MEVKKYSINEGLARAAKEANSMRDYIENSATNRYHYYINEFMAAVNELIDRNAKKPYPATPEQMELVEYYADKYSSKLAAAINRQNRIEASCPSILIPGGSNFPIRKKEKQNAARDKFQRECGELFNTTGNYYFRKIENILTNTTIYSNDALALEKLQNKLAEFEDLQAKMKERNAYYRKNKTMKGYEDVSDAEAEEIDKQIKASWENKPYPTWALTNNNAEIRRIKERIAEIERIKANAEKPIEDKYPHVDGVEVVENAEAMRIQLIFDGKPDDATRALLKSNGFRWSPSFGAWQRQLNGHGIYAAKAVLEKLK